MKRILAAGRSSEFIRFVATGAVAAGVNVAVRIPLGRVMPYSASIIVAYMVGMTTAFVLARLFVFRPAPGAAAGEYMRFVLVNMVSLVQVLLVSILTDRIMVSWWGMTWHVRTVAHVMGVTSPVVTSYYGHKLFTFRGPAL